MRDLKYFREMSGEEGVSPKDASSPSERERGGDRGRRACIRRLKAGSGTPYLVAPRELHLIGPWKSIEEPSMS